MTRREASLIESVVRSSVSQLTTTSTALKPELVLPPAATSAELLRGGDQSFADADEYADGEA